ncbi:nucleotidyltransferase domain-containing protein [Exiguobacterium acetylicum]
MTLRQQLVQTINVHVHAHFIILFGSGATGNMTDDSDLDIAYLSDYPLPPTPSPLTIDFYKSGRKTPVPLG